MPVRGNGARVRVAEPGARIYIVGCRPRRTIFLVDASETRKATFVVYQNLLLHGVRRYVRKPVLTHFKIRTIKGNHII